jgi:hypothetical protein
LKGVGGSGRALLATAAGIAAAALAVAAGAAPVVNRPISSDTLSDAGAEHATEVEPTSAAWRSTVVSAFQVGRYRDGAAQAIGFAVSTDAGVTWRHGLLPRLTTATGGGFPRASDPTAAYDAAHRRWLVASLVVAPGESGIVVSRSLDGRRWGAPVVASLIGNGPHGIAHDKEWLACDNWASSRFRGHCYLSYSDVTGRRLVTRTSADGGRTWSDAVASPDNAGRRGVDSPAAPGAQPVVLPDGTVVIPFYDAEGMAAVRSTDGGATFSTEVPIAPASFHPVGALRAAPLPSAAIGANGQIVLAWPNCASPSCVANDVVFTRSSDGLNWSAPKPVPLGPRDHVIPAISSDPTRRGRLALLSYTATAAGLRPVFVSSRNGGGNWSAVVPLAPRPTPLSWLAAAGGAMVGDYVAVSFAAGRAVSVFALARRPSGGLRHEAIYAASLRVR